MPDQNDQYIPMTASNIHDYDLQNMINILAIYVSSTRKYFKMIESQQAALDKEERRFTDEENNELSRFFFQSNEWQKESDIYQKASQPHTPSSFEKIIGGLHSSGKSNKTKRLVFGIILSFLIAYVIHTVLYNISLFLFLNFGLFNFTNAARIMGFLFASIGLAIGFLISLYFLTEFNFSYYGHKLKQKNEPAYVNEPDGMFYEMPGRNKLDSIEAQLTKEFESSTEYTTIVSLHEENIAAIEKKYQDEIRKSYKRMVCFKLLILDGYRDISRTGSIFYELQMGRASSWKEAVKNIEFLNNSSDSLSFKLRKTYEYADTVANKLSVDNYVDQTYSAIEKSGNQMSKDEIEKEFVFYTDLEKIIDDRPLIS